MPLVSTADIVGPGVASGHRCPRLQCRDARARRGDRGRGGASGRTGDPPGQPQLRRLSRRLGAHRGWRCWPSRATPRAPSRSTWTTPGPSSLVREAVTLGIGSVMFDASDLDDDANVEQTRLVTQECHRQGVWVEAELGEVGGKDGVHAATARTDPAAARGMSPTTGVDALAVAVGSSHARPTRDAALDLELVGSTPGGGPGAAGAARLVQRARRGSRGGRRRRPDQDQHRDPAQPGVHGRCPHPARRATGRLRSAAIPCPRP